MLRGLDLQSNSQQGRVRIRNNTAALAIIKNCSIVSADKTLLWFLPNHEKVWLGEERTRKQVPLAPRSSVLQLPGKYSQQHFKETSSKIVLSFRLQKARVLKKGMALR